MKEPIPAICRRFHRAVELIGGRWTGAVIQVLLRGPTRYSAIRAAIPEISDRMLSDRLRTLEAEGLVSRRVVPDTPVRVEYTLTDKGGSLESALSAIAVWADRWIPVKEAVLPQTPNGKLAAAEGTGLESSHSAFVGKPRIRPRGIL